MSMGCLKISQADVAGTFCLSRDGAFKNNSSYVQPSCFYSEQNFGIQKHILCVFERLLKQKENNLESLGPGNIQLHMRLKSKFSCRLKDFYSVILCRMFRVYCIDLPA